MRKNQPLIRSSYSGARKPNNQSVSFDPCTYQRRTHISQYEVSDMTGSTRSKAIGCMTQDGIITSFIWSVFLVRIRSDTRGSRFDPRRKKLTLMTTRCGCSGRRKVEFLNDDRTHGSALHVRRQSISGKFWHILIAYLACKIPMGSLVEGVWGSILHFTTFIHISVDTCMILSAREITSRS